ncbi:MAG: hybrid sensor histidine kinase/response regulator [Spirulinaceae cyanobacterium]
MNPPAQILIVDDNPTNLKVLSDSLKAVGHKVLVAKSGVRALRTLENIKPDIILLDVMMPELNGFETCQQIKADERLQDIPVIFMTALTEIESKVKGLQLGAVDYLTKPLQHEEVLVRVNNHVQLYRLKQNLAQQVFERTAELEDAMKHLQQAQTQLVYREKMSTLGEMVAGVAHEINNPVGFIAGNLPLAQEYVAALRQALQHYQAEFPQLPAAMETELADLEIDYVEEDLPQILTSMQAGCDRLTQLVLSLRTFARTDDKQAEPTDIHAGLDATLTILSNRLKAIKTRPKVQIVRNYGEIPDVVCYGGPLNQVFMNILANAIDAFDEANQGKTYYEIEANLNQITIATSVVNKQVEIQIQDNGCGMTPETVERIFEQGFTTKDVGKGTGLGMAIAHQIIMEKHGGMLTCTSELGQGTTFMITLPL